MDGKVVQLVQGREKALEGDAPLARLEKFAAFPQIQVIDLDAAIGSGSNDELVKLLASRAVCRVGGGVRSVERARALVEQGAHKVIVGTAAFHSAGVNTELLAELAGAVGRDRLIIAVDSKGGRSGIKGWRKATAGAAEQAVPFLDRYCSGFPCTYVYKEG